MDVNKFIEVVCYHIENDVEHFVTIQHRRGSGICVVIMSQYNGSNTTEYIFYGYKCTDMYLSHYMLYKYIDIKFAGGYNKTYIIGTDTPRYYYSKISDDSEDPTLYTDIYDYGIIDDKNHFSKILRLFLVKPRDARPINRLAFLDISVKTE
jgi:hypothetical protein